MSDRLSPHFSVAEVFDGHDASPHQVWLARRLAERVLEPIRKLMGCPLHITDGFRTLERQNDLKARGYKPYRLTDHSFIEPWQPLGVGAVDILKLVRTRNGNVSRMAFAEDEYDRIVEMFEPEEPLPYGQLIWYRRRGHIHVSNPRTLAFSGAFVTAVGFPARKATYIVEG